MVFFTCNHCGESVKKPAVEKHYNFKCRGAPKNVSCMDCQKDFHGEDYAAHTRCITEAEKYSGKDYVAKEPKNSGQKKQDNWMEIIRSILDTKEYNLSKQARATFQKLQTVDNVPRKKAKFQNFVANCMRMRRDEAEEIWGILEKELEKMKASKPPSSNGKADVEEPPESETNNKTAENGQEEPAAKPEPPAEVSPADQTEIRRVKKSKKRKVDKEIQNTIEQDEEQEILQIVNDLTSGEPSKKKKKRKSESKTGAEESTAEQEPTVSTTTPDEFQWVLVIQQTIHKYGDNMKLDKLKRKVQRMYLCKREMTALTEKQQLKFDKKFAKYIKKSSLLVENNVVRLRQRVNNN